MGNHRHSCRTYKDALKFLSGPIAPRGPLDRNCFIRAPAQVVTQPVQEQPGPSHCIEAEEPLAHLTNATDDIQMVHTAFFSFYELIYCFRTTLLSLKPSPLGIMTMVSSDVLCMLGACQHAIRTSFPLFLLMFFSKKSMWMRHILQQMHQKYPTWWMWTIFLQNPRTYHSAIQRKIHMVSIIHSNTSSHPSYHVEH